MIDVTHLNKSFDGKQILHDISIVFHPGKTNLIIGASGSGKSVLTKCIVGLYDVDSGSIKYSNREFTQMNFMRKKSIRKEIGMLFQSAALFDSLTIEENIAFPLQMHTKMSNEEILDRVNFCLDRVNLENVNHRFPSEISGGMQKRVGIARAIALKPRYLFCDEPNSGLDPQTSIVIDNLIKEITEEYNITTIIVSHDMNSVIEIGDHISYIYNGRKWWEGSNNDILHNDNKELSEFIYASAVMKKIKSLS